MNSALRADGWKRWESVMVIVCVNLARLYPTVIQSNAHLVVSVKIV